MKIRGFRIELGEVETAVAQAPGVAQAVVVVRDDRLVGYVAPEGGRNVDAQEVRAFVAEVLPEHVVRAAVVVLETIPLTAMERPTGGLCPHRTARRCRTGPQAPNRPGTPVVRRLRRGARPRRDRGRGQLLRNGRDSIIAIQVVSRARVAGLRISTRDVFVHRTVKALASVAGQVEEVRAEESAEPDVVPLTPILRWLADQGGPIDGHHQWMLLRTPPGMDEYRLSELLHAFVDCHEMLRVRLALDDSAWQLTAADADLLPKMTSARLSPDLTDGLRSQAHDHDVTLVRVAWAATLLNLEGTEDVVFAATVAGRSPEVPAMAQLVGLHTNLVPVRAHRRSNEAVLDLARRLQERQTETYAHQHHDWRPRQRNLFAAHMVFHNYPLDDESLSRMGSVSMRGVEVRDGTHYPLSLVARLEGNALAVRIDHRPDVW